MSSWGPQPGSNRRTARGGPGNFGVEGWESGKLHIDARSGIATLPLDRYGTVSTFSKQSARPRTAPPCPQALRLDIRPASPSTLRSPVPGKIGPDPIAAGPEPGAAAQQALTERDHAAIIDALWRKWNWGKPAQPVDMPWIPVGRRTRPLKRLARASRRRPLSAPSKPQPSGDPRNSLAAHQFTAAALVQPPPRHRDRSLQDILHALRSWLHHNRRHHETVRLTVLRMLFAPVDCPKNSSGVPLTVSSPLAIRESMVASVRRDPLEAFDVSLRSSATAIVTPKAPDLYASDEERIRPDRDLWQSTRRAALSDVWDFGQGGVLDDELTEAEKWAQKRQLQIERSHELRASHAQTFRDHFESEKLRLWHPGQQVGVFRSMHEFGPPPPKRADVWAELAFERSAAAKREELQKLLPERIGVQGIKMTRPMVQEAWRLACMNEVRDGAERALEYALTEAELDTLVAAFSRPRGYRPMAALPTPAEQRLRVDDLVEAIVEAENHAIAKREATRAAPQTSSDAEGKRLLVPPCRKPLVAPDDFDWVHAITLSRTAPPATLELEHVYGYEGQRNAAPNVFFTASGEVVFYAAALGVVVTPPHKLASAHKPGLHQASERDDTIDLVPPPGRYEAAEMVDVEEEELLRKVGEFSGARVTATFGRESGPVSSAGVVAADDGIDGAPVALAPIAKALQEVAAPSQQLLYDNSTGDGDTAPSEGAAADDEAQVLPSGFEGASRDSEQHEQLEQRMLPRGELTGLPDGVASGHKSPGPFVRSGSTVEEQAEERLVGDTKAAEEAVAVTAVQLDEQQHSKSSGIPAAPPEPPRHQVRPTALPEQRTRSVAEHRAATSWATAPGQKELTTKKAWSMRVHKARPNVAFEHQAPCNTAPTVARNETRGQGDENAAAISSSAGRVSHAMARSVVVGSELGYLTDQTHSRDGELVEQHPREMPVSFVPNQVGTFNSDTAQLASADGFNAAGLASALDLDTSEVVNEIVNALVHDAADTQPGADGRLSPVAESAQHCRDNVARNLTCSYSFGGSQSSGGHSDCSLAALTQHGLPIGESQEPRARSQEPAGASREFALHAQVPSSPLHQAPSAPEASTMSGPTSWRAESEAQDHESELLLEGELSVKSDSGEAPADGEFAVHGGADKFVAAGADNMGRSQSPAVASVARATMQKLFTEASGKQRFFRGHTDDVLCLAMHPSSKVVATGQIDTLKGAPYVCIWRADSGTELKRIYHPEGSRGVYACGFSGASGRFLTTVTGDDRHTVRVYDWNISKLVANGAGYSGVPPQVFGAVWDDCSGSGQERFVTYGIKHVKMWEATGDRKQMYRGKTCAWSSAEPQDVLCAAFLPAGLEDGVENISVTNKVDMRVRRSELENGMLATGHPNGSVYFWRQRMVVNILQTYEVNPAQSVSSKGNPSFLIESRHGVRCIRCWQHDLPRDAAAERRKALVQRDAARTGTPRHKQMALDAEDEAYERHFRRWFLATGGADGAVRVWDVGVKLPTATLERRTSKRTAPEPLLLPVLWVPKAVPGRVPAVRAFDTTRDGEHMAIGTIDGSVWVCNLKLHSKLQSRLHEQHMAFSLANSLSVSLLQATTALDAFPDSTPLAQPAMSRLVASHAATVHAVAAHPTAPAVFAAASHACEVSLYNTARREQLAMPVLTSAPVTAVTFSLPQGRYLAAGLADGRVEVFNRDRVRAVSVRYARDKVNDLKYDPSGTLLAVASDDLAIDLLSVRNGYMRVARCSGHSAAVRHIDFSSDGRVLRSSCAACEILYWDAATGRALAQDQHNQSWLTTTSKVGFHAIGIWQAGDDATDINAVDADAEGALLAVADDDGTVRLARHPCIVKDAVTERHAGHSSHVTCVRFSCDGGKLLSSGGADKCVLQWHVKKRVISEAVPIQPDRGIARGYGLKASGHDPQNVMHTMGSAAETAAFVDGASPAPGSRSATLTQQMLARGQVGADHVQRRVLQMQAELDRELEKIRMQSRRRAARHRHGRSDEPPLVLPSGKVWAQLEESKSGKPEFGWVDAAPSLDAAA